MTVAIATPFYSVTAYSPYIVSLINSIRFLQEAGIDFDYYELSGDSYVDRAKNSLVHRFLESDATHLFMVDSDMYWDVEGFGRVIKACMAGCEIVGAAYPCKNNWQFFGCIPKFDPETQLIMGREDKENNMRLLDMWGIPGGFLIYSREAIERTRPNLKSYTDDKGITYLECFKCNIEKNGTRVGEDIYFQLRYKEMGGLVWLEPNVTIKHIGVTSWEGNYHEYLLNERGAEEVSPMSKVSNE
jgi:hypothetical protein